VSLSKAMAKWKRLHVLMIKIILKFLQHYEDFKKAFTISLSGHLTISNGENIEYIKWM